MGVAAALTAFAMDVICLPALLLKVHAKAGERAPSWWRLRVRGEVRTAANDPVGAGRSMVAERRT